MMEAIAAIGAIGSHVFEKRQSQQQDENALSDPLFELNLMALSESSGVNTGPGLIYDCPGWFTGDGKMCMCENPYPCTDVLCQ